MLFRHFSYHDQKSHNERYNSGDYFKTKDECITHKQRLLATQEMRDLAEGYEFKFGFGESNYGITYDGNKFQTFVCNMAQATIHYFATEEKAQHAIDTLGVDKLKLIFEVK